MNSEQAQRPKLRVLIFREENADIWLAQCLEHDIATQASNLHDLRKRLDATIRAEISESLNRGFEPLSDIPKAPKYFYVMWDRRYGAITPEIPPQLLHNVALETGNLCLSVGIQCLIHFLTSKS